MTKLWCEITLANHSELSLHVEAQNNVHGGWVGDDNRLVGPGETARYTAQDPDLAAYGSEGSVTFIDGAGCTFTISYCCSYKKGGNFCMLTQASPLLDVTLRFANDVPPGNANKEWGSATPPPDGHPLGILIHVEQRTIKQSLKVLTYNTHLFKGSPAAIARPSVVQKDDERSAEILKKVIASGADIVCLQEVWSLDFQHNMTREFLKEYPYFYIAPDNTISVPWWETFLNWVLPVLAAGVTGGMSLYYLAANIYATTQGYDSLSTMLRNTLSNTSGLLLASRYPMKDCQFTMYENLSGDDKLAKKGLISFTVMLAAGKSTPAYVRMGMTHCPTDINDALRVLDSVAAPQALQNIQVDRILLGDFNLHLVQNGTETRTESEYRRLNSMLEKYQATDIVERFVPKLEDSYTDWQKGNSLTWLIDSNASGGVTPTAEKNRIDYIYFAPRTASQNFLEPSSVSIFHDWDLNYGFSAFGQSFSKLSLSDHYPVLAEFKFGLPQQDPYKNFRRHETTPLSAMEFDAGHFALGVGASNTGASDADIYCIKRSNCASGRIEAHVINAGENYKQWKLHAATALSANETEFVAYLAGDYHRRNQRDLFCLKAGGDGLELHILDGANGYGSFLYQRKLPIKREDVANFDFAIGDLTGSGMPDLYCIKRKNTSRNQLEIHVLSRVSDYQTFTFQSELPVSLSEVANGKYRFLAGRYLRQRGNADLFMVKRDNTQSGMVEISVLDGTSRFQSLLLQQQATPIPTRDIVNFEFGVGNSSEASPVAPLYCLKSSSTGSGTVEVHVLS